MPTIPTPSHVVVVVESTRGYGDIIGDAVDAPYINNTLLPAAASFTDSHGLSSYGQPNYLALFSGSTQGVMDDGTYSFNAPNLGNSLLTATLTFDGYAEDLPSIGFTGDSSGAYHRYHNPWVDFTNLPSSLNLPFANFPTDYTQLPTVSFVVPNFNNDMHDGTTAQGDSWLQSHLNGYVQWAQAHNSLLIVTWDHDGGTAQNQVPTLFVGPMVVHGNYSETINDYNVLRTVEDMYGLPHIANDATANPIGDVWTTTGPQAPVLTVAAAGTAQINLSWTEASSGVTSFSIERSTDGVNFSQIASVSGSVLSYNDMGLTAGQRYSYRMRATSSAGTSNYSPVGSDVARGVATHLQLIAPAQASVGRSFNVTTTALDQFNNAALGYTGTAHFTSSDGRATLPANYGYTAADRGSHIFAVTLASTGTQSITATDAVTSSITGTASLTVISAIVPTPSHVVVVFEENHSYSDIIGDTVDAPYINSLARQGALFTSSFGVTHPSEPNYLAFFSGSTQGVGDDGTYNFTAPNLAVSLLAAGLTYGEYSEDLPYVGYTGDSYAAYARKHNPCVSFTNVPSSINMPFTSFPSDYRQLPTVSFIDPNLGDDMHDGTIAQGDSWLQSHLNGYVQWAQTHNSLLIVTWDEDDFSQNNQVPTFFVGPMVMAGSYSESINHYNVLRTVEDMYGLAYIANDATANPIRDVWGSAAPAPPMLSVAAAGTAQINLTWTESSSGVNSFSLERSLDGTTFSALVSVAGTMFSYSDTGLAAGQRYYYRMRATNASGTSGYSGVFSDVARGIATHYVLSAPAGATAGGSFTFTVTAFDQFNNTATGYTGTVHFTSSDGAATLPASAGLNGGTASFSATLRSAGTQSVTATDTVTSTITGNVSVAVSAAAANSLQLIAPAGSVAGTSFTFTVTAYDPYGNVATGYVGTIRFTSSDGQAMLPANGPLTNGRGTFTVTLKTAGSQTITATDTVTASINGSTTVVVSPASASHFMVTAPSSTVAGAAFMLTVLALDPYGNTATGYAGIVHFTSSDGQATLPANATLTNGRGTFTANLRTAGSEIVTAVDTVTASITGSVTVSVTPATAARFSLTAPANATNGVAFSVTVTALDPYGNVATGYAGTVHFTSSDAQATLPANSTLTSGTRIFTITLRTAGSDTITATDTVTSSITGTATVSVSASGATHFGVTAANSAVAGTAFSVTVTALDASGNTVPGYSGTVHFTSTDAQAALPANATLSNGSGTFNVTLRTAGTQSITATDTVATSITGNASVTVSAAAASHFRVTGPANATAGTSFSITVAALDPYGNTSVGYASVVHFTSSDGQAALPANSPLSNGTATFSVTLRTAGSRTITATDTVTSSITGSASITVSAAAATALSVTGPANATAGTSFTAQVTALDPFGNTATTYAGTVHFTSSDPQASLPANATLTSGTGTFTITLRAAGRDTINATDTLTSSIAGSAHVSVAPAPATQFRFSAPSAATAGSAFSATVTSLDAYGNTATGYAGTVQFTSTDGQGMLPANATLANGAGTFSITLATAGSQTIRATDTITLSITGSASVAVSAAGANRFTVAGPPRATRGTAFTMTVTALDRFGNVATGYGGTVHFTSSDVAATLPANAPLASGVGSFSVILQTAGTQTIAATDTVTMSITGSVSIAVSGRIVPMPSHVVVVVESYRGYGDIIGDSFDAPYINNTLLPMAASFTDSHGISGYGQPNYLELFSGSTQGVMDDGSYSFSAPNLGNSLLSAGLTFDGYAEDLPFGGFTGDNYAAYNRYHNPWVSFTNLPSNLNLPFANFPSDYTQLPTVSFVIPNFNDDMHDGSTAQGDSWLQTNLDGYVQWAQMHNSLLILTWDHDGGTPQNQIPTLFVGPMVTPGNYSETINDDNVLRTVEDMYGLPYLANDATAVSITDVWASTGPQPSGGSPRSPNLAEAGLLLDEPGHLAPMMSILPDQSLGARHADLLDEALMQAVASVAPSGTSKYASPASTDRMPTRMPVNPIADVILFDDGIIGVTLT